MKFTVSAHWLLARILNRDSDGEYVVVKSGRAVLVGSRQEDGDRDAQREAEFPFTGPATYRRAYRDALDFVARKVTEVV